MGANISKVEIEAINLYMDQEKIRNSEINEDTYRSVGEKKGF